MVLLVLFILIGCSLCNGYVDLKANRFSNSNIKLQQLKQSRYLEDMVSRKVVEVENLLRRHSAEDDPLMMRLSYQSTSSFYNVTRSIRKPGGPKDDHMMSIIVDVKKKSPTIPSQRNVVDFSCAADYCCLLSNVGVDALLINTDDVDYGGSWDDLQLTSRALEKLNRATTPACIAKDVFIHPIQVCHYLNLHFHDLSLTCLDCEGTSSWSYRSSSDGFCFGQATGRHVRCLYINGCGSIS